MFFINGLLQWAAANGGLLAVLAVACLVIAGASYLYVRLLPMRGLLVGLALLSIGLGLAGSVQSNLPVVPGAYELSDSPVQTNLYVTEDVLPAPVDHYAMQLLANGQLNLLYVARVEFTFNPRTHEVTARWSSTQPVVWLGVAVVTKSDRVTAFRPVAAGQTVYRVTLPADQTPFSVTVAACSPKLPPANTSVRPGTCTPGSRANAPTLPDRKLF